MELLYFNGDMKAIDYHNIQEILSSLNAVANRLMKKTFESFSINDSL
jgi:hypothetical protein